MGMGYVGNSIQCIQQETVAELCPQQFATLAAFLQQYNCTLEQFAHAVQHEDEEELAWSLREDNELSDVIVAQRTKTLFLAFDKLCAAFTKATAVGESCLTLHLGYHDSDEDDSYDEVNGVFWAVGGNYQLTPAGEKFKDKVETANFVTFG